MFWFSNQRRIVYMIRCIIRLVFTVQKFELNNNFSYLVYSRSFNMYWLKKTNADLYTWCVIRFLSKPVCSNPVFFKLPWRGYRYSKIVTHSLRSPSQLKITRLGVGASSDGVVAVLVQCGMASSTLKMCSVRNMELKGN